MASDLGAWARTAPLTDLREAVAEARSRTREQSSPADEADLQALEPILADREEQAYQDWLTNAGRDELVSARDEARAQLRESTSPFDERMAYDADLRLRVLDDVDFVKDADRSYNGRQTIDHWLADRLEHGMPLEELRAVDAELQRTADSTFTHALANWFSDRVAGWEERVERLIPEEVRGERLDRVGLDARAEALRERIEAGQYLGRAEDAARLEAVLGEQAARDRADAEAWAAPLTTDQLATELQTLQDRDEFGQGSPVEQSRLAHGSDILHERQLAAIDSWVNGLSTDELRVTIVDLEQRVERGTDPLAAEKLFWAESALWGREHGDKGLDTVVIDAGGRVGTIRELATEAYGAYAQGALDALTGNFVAALTFHLSDDPHLAAMVGGLFDVVGGVAQGRAEFKQIQASTVRDGFEPLPEAASTAGRALDQSPGASSEPFPATTSAKPAVDWNALRERVDEPVPRQSDHGYRMQQVREGAYSVIKIEGVVGESLTNADVSAARYGTRLPGEDATHGGGMQVGENLGPSSLASAPRTFNVSQMKVFENLLRQTADAAAPFGAVVETMTYLHVEHRVVKGEEVQVLVGVERSGSLRLPGSDTLYPVGHLAAEIDPVTREVRTPDDGAPLPSASSAAEATASPPGVVQDLRTSPQPSPMQEPPAAVPATPQPSAGSGGVPAAVAPPSADDGEIGDEGSARSDPPMFDMEADATSRQLDAETDAEQWTPSPLLDSSDSAASSSAAGQDSAGQDSAGQDSAGQDSAGQDRAGQDSAVDQGAGDEAPTGDAAAQQLDDGAATATAGSGQDAAQEARGTDASGQPGATGDAEADTGTAPTSSGHRAASEDVREPAASAATSAGGLGLGSDTDDATSLARERPDADESDDSDAADLARERPDAVTDDAVDDDGALATQSPEPVADHAAEQVAHAEQVEQVEQAEQAEQAEQVEQVEQVEQAAGGAA